MLLETLTITPLQIVWFTLIAVLWLGYFFLEGFDYGVGMLLPILGKTEKDRRVMINTIGPVWDGNEVWLLTAGGATFAAFPGWYATLFSAFYLPLFLVLLGLILRGVAFEYRGKRNFDSWRSMFDWFAIIGSLLPSLVFGVGFANFVAGVPLNDKTYLLDKAGLWTGDIVLGELFGVFTPFTLLGGVMLVSLFLTHGAVFIALKTSGGIRESANSFAAKSGYVSTALVALFVIWQNLAYPAGGTASIITWITGVLAILATLGATLAAKAERDGWAIIITGLAIVTLFAGVFVKMFGNLGFSHAVDGSYVPYEFMPIASASGPTLMLMTIAAVIFVPIVLAYQAWSYWVFHKRLSTADIPPALKDPVSA
ncbi:MAG: cytochrome d ubiquinol oxidase subunit II [Propionibacterium sp.]|nr:MAG: cytochrome d ubiquinol oxidase subunit II [Propionibacterium sp.]